MIMLAYEFYGEQTRKDAVDFYMMFVQNPQTIVHIFNK